MSNPIVVTALALVISVTALRASTAQTNDQTGTDMNNIGGGCPLMGIMSQGTMTGLQAGMMAMVDGRLAYLKQKLKITVPQSEAWDDYATAARSQATVLQSVQNAMMDVMQNGTAIERMDIRIRSMKAMVGALMAVEPATTRLYEVLSSDQKKMADQMIGIDCGAL